VTLAGTIRSQRWTQPLLVLLVYLVLSCLYSRPMLSDPLHDTLQGGQGDPGLFMWFLSNTSTALFHNHGHGLLVTHALNSPHGVNVLWNTGLLLPGVLLAPITATAGPVLSLNVLVICGPALSAWAAYLCSRRFLTRPSARIVTGLAFGFSPALLAAALGHFQLSLLMLVPPLLLLTVDAATGHRGPWRSGALIGVLAACQLLIGEEVLVLTVVAAAVLLVVIGIQRPRLVRERITPLLWTSAVAAATTLLLAGYPLLVQFFGSQRVHGEIQTPDFYVLDPAQLILPTGQLLGLDPTGGLLHTTRLNSSESMGYLGLPLLLLVGVVLWVRRKDIVARTAGLSAAALAVLSLGFTLHLAGHRTGIPTPWGASAGAPVISSLLPVRWMLFVDLLVALLVGLAVESLPRTGRHRYVAAALIGLILVTLVPAELSLVGRVRTPAFFTSEAKDLRGTVLLVPIPIAHASLPMTWHAESGERFAIPGGYFVAPGPHNKPTFGSYPKRTLERALMRLASYGGSIPIDPTMRAAAATDLAFWDARTVVLGPTKHHAECLAFLTELLRRDPVETGGVLIWRDVEPARI
jgi:hypothetical protein